MRVTVTHLGGQHADGSGLDARFLALEIENRSKIGVLDGLTLARLVELSGGPDAGRSFAGFPSIAEHPTLPWAVSYQYGTVWMIATPTATKNLNLPINNRTAIGWVPAFGAFVVAGISRGKKHVFRFDAALTELAHDNSQDAGSDVYAKYVQADGTVVWDKAVPATHWPSRDGSMIGIEGDVGSVPTTFVRWLGRQGAARIHTGDTANPKPYPGRGANLVLVASRPARLITIEPLFDLLPYPATAGDAPSKPPTPDTPPTPDKPPAPPRPDHPTPPTPPPAGGSMLTDQHKAVITQMYERFRPAADDESRRVWTRKVAEQLAASFPNDAFGHKAAAPDRPPSKDAIARQQGGRLFAVDLLAGDTNALQFLDVGDITGQHFIAVQPVNHLGGPSTPVPQQPPQQQPPSTPSTGTADNAALIAALDRLTAAIDRHTQRL